MKPEDDEKVRAAFDALKAVLGADDDGMDEAADAVVAPVDEDKHECPKCGHRYGAES